MLFDAAGPFELPRNRGAEERWKALFWGNVEEYWEGLSQAIGCYVFSLDFGKSSKPWYVGLTLAPGGFKSEVFQRHKMEHYDDVLRKKTRGKPQMTFFPLVTEGTWAFSYSVSSNAKAIEWLERTLIGMALSRNPEVRNVRDTRMHRSVFVNGVLGNQFQGRRHVDANYARKLFIG